MQFMLLHDVKSSFQPWLGVAKPCTSYASSAVGICAGKHHKRMKEVSLTFLGRNQKDGYELAIFNAWQLIL